MFSRLSSKGQITIPKKVRDSLGLRPTDLVGYALQEDGVLLKRVEPFDGAFHKALDSTLEEWNSPEDEETFRDL
jgi:antitoxin PrlF